MERRERYLTNQLMQRSTTSLVEVSLIRSGSSICCHYIPVLQTISYEDVHEIQMDAGSNSCEFLKPCY